MNTEKISTSGAALAARDLRQPHGLYDEEGSINAEGRVNAAIRSYVLDIGATTALRLEACVHCGMCAEACPFYINTGDPRYTPIHKVEPLKQAYKREAGPFAPFYKFLNLKPKVTIDELREWEELLYDSCTLCGRCSLICPMGIDITALIGEARRGMAEAGLVPKELYAKASNQRQTGNVEGVSEQDLAAKLRAVAQEYQVDIPIDEPKASVMVCTTWEELTRYPATVAAMAKVMKHAGDHYTFCSQALDASNYAYMEGSLAWQRDAVIRIVDAAKRCGAEYVVMPEDAYAYVALRWEGTELYGRALPVTILHISEYLLDKLETGVLHFKSDSTQNITLQESCQLVRRGGIVGVPERLLEAMGVTYNKPAESGAFVTCCGGGGGLLDNRRGDSLRSRVFEAKMREIEATQSDTVVTTCSVCRRTFDEGVSNFEWDKTVCGLTELVAAHLS